MSITSLKTGTTGLSAALDNNYMEPIATTVVGSGGQSTITFDNIPGTYKHLQLRALYQPAATDYTSIRFNGDTGNNYFAHYLRGSGSAASAGAFGTRSDGLLNDNTTGASGSIFCALVCDILDYANTNKYKTSRTLFGIDANGSGYGVELTSSAWSSTDAITKIVLANGNNSNFAQYSRFSLYGIKG